MRILTSIAIGLFVLSQPVFAEEDHHHGSSEQSRLQLDSGKKWETDAPLRAGMIGIRDALQAKHSEIHKNKMTRRQYALLSDKITENVNSIFKNCKLSPKADAQLHLILVEIIDGAKAMKSADKLEERRQGAVKIVGALKQYPEFFEHAGWKPLE